MSEAAPRTETLGVALSGGGLRASLHGLGALLYLVDAGINVCVTSIVSVSGGSITNALVWLDCDFKKVTADEFRQTARRLVSFVTRQGLFPSAPYALYLIALMIPVSIGLVALLSTWIEFWPPGISWTMFALSMLLATIGWFLRGTVLSGILRHRLLNQSGRRVRVGELDRSLEHVFMATDLNHGSPVFISTWNGGHIYSDAHGWVPQQIPVEDAVRASAAFPGAFPPKRIQLNCVAKPYRSRLSTSYEESSRRFDSDWHDRRRGTSWMYLADGGVWNNLGTSWWGFWEDSRELDIEAFYPHHGMSTDDVRSCLGPSVKLVINSSAPFQVRPTLTLRIPLIGELVAIMRVLVSLYQNTVSPRVRALRKGNLLADPELQRNADSLLENENYTAIVNIDEEAMIQLRSNFGRTGHIPKDVMRRFQHWQQVAGRPGGTTVNPDPTLGTSAYDRYREWRGTDAWKLHNRLWEVTSRAARVPTTLGRLSAEEAAVLMEHGYIHTMANLYVLHDFPLLPIPEPNEFLY